MRGCRHILAMSRLGTWLVAHSRDRPHGHGRVRGVRAPLRLDFRYGDLLPQGHPFMEVHNRFRQNFGEANVLTVMIEARSGTIFRSEI